MYLDLAPLWADVFAVFMHVLLDGFGPGVSILFGFHHDEKARDLMLTPLLAD